MRASSSWLAHLRAGGTTPWAAYDLTAPAHREAAPGGADPITGAQQLEVLRRLNELGRVSPTLTERVLRADLTGRGHGLLRLAGDEGAERRFGTPPVDPADLATWELLRVVIGLVAEDVVRAGVPASPPAQRPRRHRVHYYLGGHPWLTAPAREDLGQRGHPEGGSHPLTFLVGRDLASMLADAWAWRSVANGGPATWEEWLAGLRRSDQLPWEADLQGHADRWAAQVGAENIRIVTDPALLPRLLGVDAVAQPPALSADAIELARLVGPLVSLLAGEARPDLMRGRLAPWLSGRPGPRLVVPEEFRPWVAEQADRARRDLIGSHYAVLGDPDLGRAPSAGRLEDPAGSDGVPTESAALELGLRLLLENDPDSRVEGA